MVFEFFLNSAVAPGAQVTLLADSFRTGVATINLIAVFVGTITLVRNNLYKLRRAEGFLNQFMVYEMLGLFAISLVIGLAYGHQSATYSEFTEYTLTAASTSSIGTYNIWMLYAAYRGLRARTLDGAALLIPAILVMAGSAPWGYINVPALGTIQDFLLTAMTGPVFRAIVLGGGIGSAATAFRTIIGRESSMVRRTD
jgi:hypothetical protein